MDLSFNIVKFIAITYGHLSKKKKCPSLAHVFHILGFQLMTLLRNVRILQEMESWRSKYVTLDRRWWFIVSSHILLPPFSVHVWNVTSRSLLLYLYQAFLPSWPLQNKLSSIHWYYLWYFSITIEKQLICFFI